MNTHPFIFIWAFLNVHLCFWFNCIQAMWHMYHKFKFRVKENDFLLYNEVKVSVLNYCQAYKDSHKVINSFFFKLNITWQFGRTASNMRSHPVSFTWTGRHKPQTRPNASPCRSTVSYTYPLYWLLELFVEPGRRYYLQDSVKVKNVPCKVRQKVFHHWGFRRKKTPWLSSRRYGRLILHPDNGVPLPGQGRPSEILGVCTTFKLLPFWRHTHCVYFSNSRWKYAEELKYILPHLDNSQAYQD